ncbi:disulfide bond formation protein B [Azoarcus sp. TTM-91]|uniref:disulfide bond formation protein B n=1 Tax=Azoarcus sp. TTM-91 TaxID=2691581 RepID=UPI00145D24E9|nr:disulfide bond formation protein B [Azoarcus sp. TTM-91]NMG33907.1 disulfide bond formation protein B [Azoarcus sp. TTM-91]
MPATFLSYPRGPFLALFLICTGLLGFGLYLQHAVGLQPCPMCIMQRYAFVTIALVSLVAGIHGPARTGRKAYILLILIAALAGAGVAARQSWIQLYPPEFAECGPDLGYMLDSFPLAESLPMIFGGSGDCSAVDWTFLSLSIANWSLLCLLGIAAVAVHQLLRRR